MCLFIGIARATTKSGPVNLVYNIRRLIFLTRRPWHEGQRQQKASSRLPSRPPKGAP